MFKGFAAPDKGKSKNFSTQDPHLCGGLSLIESGAIILLLIMKQKILLTLTNILLLIIIIITSKLIFSERSTHAEMVSRAGADSC